jgi:DGQHR domain-containing protein
MNTSVRVPAIEVRQGPGRTLYTFAIDGKLVGRFATVSRIRRTDEGALSGYQRPEVLSHIQEIRSYIESAEPMVPNAVVIAFDSRVVFEPGVGPKGEYSRVGELVIPIEEDTAPELLPGFIVDGQQRLAAIREANVPHFPICVSAFITDDVKAQTEQFILVNSTKPLPKGLIYELLPSTETHLPTFLARRRLPTVLLTKLNRMDGSPFKGLIQTPTNPDGVVKDNSVLKMLENSLSDGVLYRLCRAGGDEVDVEVMLGVLFNYWGSVGDVFPSDWGLPPKRSRLLHGAGIVSLGFLMDAISDRYRHAEPPTRTQFGNNLKPLKSVCRWSDGYWEFGPAQQRKWNEIQNTSKDIQLLSNYLLIQYKSLVWNRARSAIDRQMPLTAE